MGNQLTGIAPSQILSVDHYFSDLADYEFDGSLGSTRFFKVARAQHKEGLCVVKVFAIQDPSLPLKQYQDELKDIKIRLSNAPNVLPFQRSVLSDKASLLIRQFVKDNLYDRISTRPFLNLIEKKWIVYQLLCALEQCHSVQVCHGDIKAENIMVTSWNWVLLTDIASFKPVYLPEDNPADFTFFFDTSRRRTCYVAPERFLDARQTDALLSSGSTSLGDSQSSGGPSLPDMDMEQRRKRVLQPAMDIFSIGCVIAELLSEGNKLFDLSELLAYRNGDYHPKAVLEKIEDNQIREMVEHMISKDPSQRLIASEYLRTYGGSVFPEQFSRFLETYMTRFATFPLLTSDEKVSRIKRDINLILKELLPPEHSNSEKPVKDKDGCLVIIVSLLTSCVRTCKYCVSKLTALELMTTLSHHVSDDIILERLLPYMLFMVNDTLPQIRAQAIKTLTHCLHLVKNITRSDANIFPEYILPSLSWLTQDAEVVVRLAYAESIASLAETALKFLEMAQLDRNNVIKENQDDTPIQYQGSYDTELQALHEIIQRKVVTLLSDPENIVKRTLLENGITRLCVFFGRQKANDVLLSHMITFLNDKYDWQLRGAFFDSIVGIAAYVGWQSIAMLRPLLEQGLSDTEEFVVCKALNALTCIAELGLLRKPTLLELVSEIVPFLCHPNMWVRYGAVGFVAAVARTLNVADVHCHLLPLLQSFLKQPVIQVDQEVILVSLLKEPINRAVYDFVIKSPQIGVLFDSLQERQRRRSVCRSGQRPTYPETEEVLVPLFRKLHSQGVTEQDEDKLLYLKDIMLKLHRAKVSASDQPDMNDTTAEGEIDLKIRGKGVMKRHAELPKTNDSKLENTGTNKKGNNKNKKQPVDLQMNAEWHQMFGSTESGTQTLNRRDMALSQNASRPKSPLKKTVSVPANQTSVPSERPRSPSGPLTAPVVPARSESMASLGKQQSMISGPQPLDVSQITMQARFADCKLELRKLVHHKRDQFAADMKEKDIIRSVLSESKKPQQQRWSPKGQLVAHLHEHKAAINRIQLSQDLQYFATASDDGSVKLWDLQKLDGTSLINKSRQTYSRQGFKMKALVFCESSSSIACASNEGILNVFRIEQSNQQPSGKLQVYQKKINPTEEGHVVDMAHFDTGSQSVLTYATSNGYVCGWDLRSASMAWKLENDASRGLVTSFVVDPCHCWLVVGTSTGNMVCWDLRFQLPITSLAHPSGARIRRLATHPTEQSWVVSAVQGNNEVNIWDLETGSRRQTLWASNTPPLSQTQVSPHAVHALYSSLPDTSPYIITAGSDKRIRMWDLAFPEHSQMVAGAATDNLSNVVLQYKSRLIDGTEVFQEVYCKPRQGAVHEDMPRRGPEQPPVGHHECINDLIVSKSPQNFIITAGRDGVVKIWK
ncbi:phosphoinositide 3-kinase regulatory subunit 4-like [Actinia tenebrosa]|uniref:non-specific serine/threonine protein kinase n=1 Tax=Actinia tenebrosa TaxID=6105 RepID=A0A6P8IP53_ACTTE|nr:phosphoinositide 3-kinase regulatory subunit 4-like [Actinia tenebrosa]